MPSLIVDDSSLKGGLSAAEYRTSGYVEELDADLTSLLSADINHYGSRQVQNFLVRAPANARGLWSKFLRVSSREAAGETIAYVADGPELWATGADAPSAVDSLIKQIAILTQEMLKREAGAAEYSAAGQQTWSDLISGYLKSSESRHSHRTNRRSAKREDLAVLALEIARRSSSVNVAVDSYIDDEGGPPLTVISLAFGSDPTSAAAAYQDFMLEWAEALPPELRQSTRVLFTCTPTPVGSGAP